MKILKIISILFITNISYSQELDNIQNLVEQQEFRKAINKTKLLEKEYFCEQQEILGFCYWQLNEFRSAIKYYQNYVNNCDLSVTPYVNIGDSYFKLGIGDSAYIYFSRAYELDPENHIVNFNLGMINYTSSYDIAAKYHFKRAIKHSPILDFDSYDMLIEIHNQLQEFDSSFMVVDDLIDRAEREQQINRALLTRAFIYGDMGQYEQCKQEINKIIKDNKLDSINIYSAYYNRYLCHYMLNDKINACADYKFLISQNPSEKPENFYNCE